MNSKVLFVTILVAIMVSSCNMPIPGTQPTELVLLDKLTPIVELTPIYLGGNRVGPETPTVVGQTDDNTLPVISLISTSNSEFYYGNSGCGPTQVTISAQVTDNTELSMVAVNMAYAGDVQGGGGGIGEVMQPVGNDMFSYTIDALKPQNPNVWYLTSREGITITLGVYAYDVYGNKVQIGEWDPALKNNAKNIQIPSIRLLPCYPTSLPELLSTTQAPLVEQLLTSTPTIYLDLPTVTPTPTDTGSEPSSPPAQGPTSMTSSYVELYDFHDSNQGVDLDNSGGPDEMAYLAYDSSDPNPGHAIGQHGGRGTVWASWGGTPTYDDCRSITSWNPGIFVAQGNIFCYITDQGNYGYLRIDRLEQIGTGGSELQPWVLGFSYTTWLP